MHVPVSAEGLHQRAAWIGVCQPGKHATLELGVQGEACAPGADYTYYTQLHLELHLGLRRNVWRKEGFWAKLHLLHLVFHLLKEM